MYLEINLLVLNLSARTCLLGCSQGHGGCATELWSGGHVSRAPVVATLHVVKLTAILVPHPLRHFLDMLPTTPYCLSTECLPSPS